MQSLKACFHEVMRNLAAKVAGMSEYLAFCRFNFFPSHLLLEKQRSLPGSAALCWGRGQTVGGSSGPWKAECPRCSVLWCPLCSVSSGHISVGPLNSGIVQSARQMKAWGRTIVFTFPSRYILIISKGLLQKGDYFKSQVF